MEKERVILFIVYFIIKIAIICYKEKKSNQPLFNLKYAITFVIDVLFWAWFCFIL